MANAIHVIVPYRHASTWVFDDPRVGLSQEPFVSGIPEMIDTMDKRTRTFYFYERLVRARLGCVLKIWGGS